MKARLEQHLADALAQLKRDGLVPEAVTPPIQLSRTKDPSHGDFASNLAMMLAKPAGKNPRDIAEALIAALPDNTDIKDVQIAGPGFINFFQAGDAQTLVVNTVLDRGADFGRSEIGAGQKIQVEYVSANPTGPLHVGHGRGAALGATIANLLDRAGYDVQREYYVNDAGRQMHILAASVWLRYLQEQGVAIRFPSNGYRGEYIKAIAKQLSDASGSSLVKTSAEVFAGAPVDALNPNESDATTDAAVSGMPEGLSLGSEDGDKEAHIDALIANAQSLLGDNAYMVVFNTALNDILDDIKDDLGEFGVHYDEWFSERSLSDDIDRVVKKLVDGGHIYTKDGAQWFRSTDFGDDKDRVVRRDNGQTTYFASDIAYINNKLERGFDRVLYIFGADHHGYTERMHAAAQALGYERDRLEFLLIQFANLYRGGERVSMTTRGGSFVTIRELRDEVGKDAARYFYVMRKYQQHLDFDIDLAKSESNDNPVYYVQYAHARICSVFRQLEQRGMSHDIAAGRAALDRLVEPEETELLTLLATFPEIIERAAIAHEPHQVTGYLRDLANGLHSYYNAHKFLVEDEALRHARLTLLVAVKQVLINGLGVLDVSTPEVM